MAKRAVFSNIQWTKWRVVLIIWALLSLMSVSQGYLDSLRFPVTPSLLISFFWAQCVWFYWLLVTPLIFWLGQRFPFRQPHRLKAIVIHIFLSLLFSIVHLFIIAWINSLKLVPSFAANLSFWQAFRAWLQSSINIEIIFYWAILVAGIAYVSNQESRARELRTAQLEAQLGQARLQALKMQIQPHFLFNALNTIAMLIRTDENKQAVNMVAGLGDLLRESLAQHHTPEVSLAAEIAFTRQYLKIEQFRFSDQLHIEFDITEDASQATVPNMILQPLIENAVRHGITKRSSAGQLRIAARRESNWLVVEVQDDGPGLPLNWNEEDNHGIGLANTRNRLRQLYGENHLFTIQNNNGTNGVCVEVRIPYLPYQ
jgi:sensor histidine kinase YesM